jgi:hypothetical protein
VLRVVTSGFPLDASWDGWVEGTRRGWVFELSALKHYLERHRGEDRRVAYVRRRVPVSFEEAWSRLIGPASRLSLLAGQVFDDSPLRQHAAIVDDPPDAMLRVSIEPCMPGMDDVRDVTLWLSAWGPAAAGIPGVAQEWSETLARAFPEGRAL